MRGGPGAALRPPRAVARVLEGSVVGTDWRAHIAELVRRAGVEAEVLAAPEEWGLAGPAPQAAVRPRDEAAVVAVLAAARQEGWALAVRGGGRCDGWGAPLRRGPVVVLDTTALAGVVAHVPGDLTARVLPGTPLPALNAALGRHGQLLACDPPGAARATVGGVVASEAWGPGRLLLGGPRDFTLGLRVVDGAGRLFRTGGHVVKNVSGLDIGKLLVGSFGTLGVITEVAVRLRPLPPSGVSWAATYDGPDQAFAAAGALVGGSFSALGVAVQDAPGGRIAVVARLEGGSTQVADQLERLRPLAPENRVQERADRAWAAAHEPTGEQGASLLVRLEVPEGALGELFRIAGDLPLPARRTAWAGIGTLWCALGPEAPDAACLRAAQALRAAAQAAGGRAVVAACPASVREAVAPFGEPGPLLPWFRAVKDRFDPDGILGPGRFVGGL